MGRHEELLTTREVAALFYVNPRTVRRWVHAGKLSDIRTPGGKPRYIGSEVRALLDPEDDRPGVMRSPPAAGPVPPTDRAGLTSPPPGP